MIYLSVNEAIYHHAWVFSNTLVATKIRPCQVHHSPVTSAQSLRPTLMCLVAYLHAWFEPEHVVQENPCDQTPAVAGNGTACIQRWTFHPDTGKCEEFEYGGKLGNQNNFRSLVDCELACLPVCTVLFKGIIDVCGVLCVIMKCAKGCRSPADSGLHAPESPPC
jgi:hypothetical protein